MSACSEREDSRREEIEEEQFHFLRVAGSFKKYYNHSVLDAKRAKNAAAKL